MPAYSPLRPPLPDGPGQPLFWSRLYGSARGLAIVEAARNRDGPLLVLMPDVRTSTQVLDEIRFYGDGELPILIFPDRESLPYDAISPHPDIVSRRLHTLSRLPQLERGIVIATVSTVMHFLCPRTYVGASSFHLRSGDRVDLPGLRARLASSGYNAVSQVMEPGEFAVRGGLIDLFPMGAPTPYRIDLFGDEVETLRTFNPETQLSRHRLDEIDLLPAREYPLTDEAIQRFRGAYRARFAGDPQQSSIYRDVSKAMAPAGGEYYLPLFFDETATLFDYLPANTLCIAENSLDQVAETFLREAQDRYEQLRHDTQRPILAPSELFVSVERLREAVSHRPAVRLLPFRAEEPDTPAANAAVAVFDAAAPPPLPVERSSESPYAALFNYISEFDGRVLIAASSPGKRETLKALLADHHLFPRPLDRWREFLHGDDALAITVADIDRGLVLPEPRLAIVTEAQLYGERAAQQRRRGQPRGEIDAVIRSLAELRPGDPVVHEEYGIGRYIGLATLDVGDGPTEFLALEYAGGDKIYVPVVALHFISRYTATNPEHAPLHRLGTDAWDKARRRAQEKARDAAAELLEIYALRTARTGYSFPPADEQYTAFAEAFPFEETPDQQRAIQEVVRDMTTPRPMDRLVCGDVGFGKTEVAMRAAFIAVHGHKQVAVLAPTTLLAQQHFQNFSDRFADVHRRPNAAGDGTSGTADPPVNIDLLSRFRSKSEQAEVLDALADGKVDILIGTHRVLQPDVLFHDLGLVIIDEEHRFGVQQKERLKKLRADVDILTLTATPIPRTLNMAMAELRDISIIATPPQERLAVKTFVMEWHKGLIREACLREIRRGGQVFFLHNEVRTMEKALQQLRDLVPEADIRMAHGQMPERELESIMLDFYHQRFNILVCSTIIESGIDIPTANTIVIERADRFGLAQLHQLRGRVGRSHHRAYAYLIIPPRNTLNLDAQKRLQAIESLVELGAGFALASHDLEIRGAGELLGESQSGEIDEVGFSMYSELLSRAVQSLREGKAVDLDDVRHSGTEINLHTPALLPDDYLPDIHMRLVLYKRISNAADDEALSLLREEIIDRFGMLPEPARLLFDIAKLRIRATALDMRRIDAGPKGARLDFHKQAKVDPASVITLLQSEPRRYRLDGPARLRIVQEMPDAKARIAALTVVLNALQPLADR